MPHRAAVEGVAGGTAAPNAVKIMAHYLGLRADEYVMVIAARKTDRSRLAVLLIENDPADAAALSDYIEQIDWARTFVTRAPSVEQGRREFDRTAFDAVVVDLSALDGTGIEATEAVLVFARDVPVIVIAGTQHCQVVDRAFELGIADCLDKSTLTSEQICRVLRHSLVRTKAIERLLNERLRDPLTGFGTKPLLESRLEQASARSRRSDLPFGVVFVELDRFGAVCAERSQLESRRLLELVSKRIRTCIREIDYAARWNGSSFCVLVEDLSGPAMVEMIADRIRGEIAEPYRLEMSTVQLTASVGAAYGRGAVRPHELLRQADQAARRAKRAGGNRIAVIHPPEGRELDQSQNLARALRDGEFALWFQPQIEVIQNRLWGLEACLRWEHPERGTLMPASFLSELLGSDLVHGVSTWVLRSSCDQIAAIQHYEGACHPPRIGINVHSRQLVEGGTEFAHALDESLRRLDLPPQSIELELTDSAAMIERPVVVELLGDLAERGVRLALDKFSELSCLACLEHLQVDTVKLDPPFIYKVPDEPRARAITRGIATITGDLGIDVICVGVEREDQRDFLCELGLTVQQGFLYGRPMPKVTLQAWLDTKANHETEASLPEPPRGDGAQ